ncbi:hypothetical protein ES332_D07G044000v1 [Gossypium tomentosum]|uniref:Uncharacterized protein n=1 Tax=Gossypium tomentosum TaxID=34277 RepID=A0A5D2K349_GOSTO|nr:hypothetical protein ES332_D07G044000v1 [Gossypium tomentosum]
MEGKMSWTVADAVDYKGFPADRSKTGGWVPAALILGMLVASTSFYIGLCRSPNLPGPYQQNNPNNKLEAQLPQPINLAQHSETLIPLTLATYPPLAHLPTCAEHHHATVGHGHLQEAK